MAGFVVARNGAPVPGPADAEHWAASDIVSQSPFFAAERWAWIPFALRSERTRRAVQVLPWPVGIPIRFNRGDILVRPSARHRPYYGERLFGRPAAMLAGVRLADEQLRVLAAAPMAKKCDLLVHRSG